MILTFAGELTKMINAGLGRESAAPDTGVAVGRYSEYIEVSDAAIATFDTNAALPLRALTVEIEPIQDLHGQDAPYPDGGGKNLQPYFEGKTVAGITFTVDDMGVLTANGTATRDSLVLVLVDTSTTYGNFLFNGAYGGSQTTYNLYYSDAATGERAKKWDGVTPCENGFEPFQEVQIAQGHETYMIARVMNGYTANNVKFYPMLCRSTETSTTFAPYSNICPISGRSEVRVWREATYDTSADPALTIPLGQTVYGGTVDATSGTLTATMANIASYDGETLPGKWISDRDVYAPDTTPTTGAQVVYELAEPVEVELTPQQIETLIGTNNVWSDGGNVSLTYTKYNYTEGY